MLRETWLFAYVGLCAANSSCGWGACSHRAVCVAMCTVSPRPRSVEDPTGDVLHGEASQSEKRLSSLAASPLGNSTSWDWAIF